MKKIMFIICVMNLLGWFATSCGPTAEGLEEQRLADSVLMASDSSRYINSKSLCDSVMSTMVYYKDETTGFYYAVVENNGQVSITVLPGNSNIPYLRTFKSK